METPPKNKKGHISFFLRTRVGLISAKHPPSIRSPAAAPLFSITRFSIYVATMENLKSGDVPALVTNIELLSILSDKIVARKEKEASEEVEGQPLRWKNKKLEHRDYIEDSVHDYLQSSACAYLDKNEMPNFIYELRNGKQLSNGVSESETREVESTGVNSMDNKGDIQKEIDAISRYEHDYDEDSDRSRNGPALDETMSNQIASPSITPSQRDVTPGGFGLTDAETLQILNLMPKEPVEIHLMIEELQSRFDDDRQQELLNIIAKYSRYNDHVESEEIVDEMEDISQDHGEDPNDSYE